MPQPPAQRRVSSGIRQCYLGLENLQGWRLHNLTGQLVPLELWSGFLLSSSLILPLSSSLILPRAHCQEPSSAFYMMSSWVLASCCHVLLKPCCPQAGQAVVLQPVCTRQVFQPPDHLGDGPCCNYQCLPYSGGSKLDAAAMCDLMDAGWKGIITPCGYQLCFW